MRPKAEHSMMSPALNTSRKRSASAESAAMSKMADPSGPDPPRRLARTSRPEPPASDPPQIRSPCNGKRRRQTCRSLHERRPEAQTKDATDTKASEARSRGRSQTLFYNHYRPHGALAGLTPKQYLDKRRAEAAPQSHSVLIPDRDLSASRFHQNLSFRYLLTGSYRDRRHP